MRWLRLVKNGLGPECAAAKDAGRLTSAEEVAGWLVGVQAQDLHAAFLAIWNRLDVNSTVRFDAADKKEVELDEEEAGGALLKLFLFLIWNS